MLFLRGLPEDLTRRELKMFVQCAIKGADSRMFAFGAVVSNHDIVRITDPVKGTTEYHGLVEIQPAKAAIRAIEWLNGRELKGRTIEARRYYNRSLLRDRFKNWGSRNTARETRHERRRSELRIELVGR
jgi:hypothetical protein